MGKLYRLDGYLGNPRQGGKAPAKPRPLAVVRVHEAMLEFRDIREGIRSQTESLSKYYRVRAPPRPDDFDLRIARVLYAMYLLDTLENALHVIDKRDWTNLLSSFESASRTVRELLDAGYFSKTTEQIIAGYYRLEGPLRACASRCGIEVLMPEPAAESFKMKLAYMIDEINERLY